MFLDANILFSAAKSDGAVRALLRRLLERGHQAVADTYVVMEARRNLEAKGAASLAVLDALLARLEIAAVASQASLDLVTATAWLPEKDRPVLAGAIRLGCDALVSGDWRHFGSGYGQAFGGVTIHSPRSLAELVLESRPLGGRPGPGIVLP